jgi:hypothetical protein
LKGAPLLRLLTAACGTSRHFGDPQQSVRRAISEAHCAIQGGRDWPVFILHRELTEYFRMIGVGEFGEDEWRNALRLLRTTRCVSTQFGFYIG